MNPSEFFEVGDKTSLICVDTVIAEAVRDSLRELGFKYHSAESPDKAIDRMRYTSYDTVVIQEDFGGVTLKSNPVLNYLAPMPMAQRRHSMVVLIGSSFKTLDAMQAFGQSVHLVVNIRDMISFTPILKKSWAEFGMMYKIYKEVFAALGEK